jgi:uncharacterized membrane protein
MLECSVWKTENCKIFPLVYCRPSENLKNTSESEMTFNIQSYITSVLFIEIVILLFIISFHIISVSLNVMSVLLTFEKITLLACQCKTTNLTDISSQQH